MNSSDSPQSIKKSPRKRDPLLGYSNGHLKFLKLLGRGAMGAVYLGQQIQLERDVAIKVIRSDVANEPSYVERFGREARALGRVRHPHVIACHDHGWQDGPNERLLVLVLEYINGPTLTTLLRRQDLPLFRTLELFAQAAEGLAAAHAAGISHRDIKPDNILCTREGIIKISDFGLAKGGDSSTVTQTGAVVGTPAYMAPEVCRGDDPGPPADVYSLACSIWEAITGMPPYRGQVLQVMQQHISGPVPDLKHIRGELKNLAVLLRQCFKKNNPNQRPSASDVAHKLREISADIDRELPTRLPETATVASHIPPDQRVDVTATAATHQPAVSIVRRHWLTVTIAFLALITVTMVVLIGFLAQGGSITMAQEVDLNEATELQRPKVFDEVTSILSSHDIAAADDAAAMLAATDASPDLPWASERLVLLQAVASLQRDAATAALITGQLNVAAEKLQQRQLDQEVTTALAQTIPDGDGFAGLRQRQVNLASKFTDVEEAKRNDIEMTREEVLAALLVDDFDEALALLAALDVPSLPNFSEENEEIVRLSAKVTRLKEEHIRSEQTRVRRKAEREAAKKAARLAAEQAAHEQGSDESQRVKLQDDSMILLPHKQPAARIQAPLVPRPFLWSADLGNGQLSEFAQPASGNQQERHRFRLEDACAGHTAYFLLHAQVPMIAQFIAEPSDAGSPKTFKPQMLVGRDSWQLYRLQVPKKWLGGELVITSAQPFWLGAYVVAGDDFQPDVTSVITSPLVASGMIPQQDTGSAQDRFAVVVGARSSWADRHWGSILFGKQSARVAVARVTEPKLFYQQAKEFLGSHEQLVILVDRHLFRSENRSQIKELLEEAARLNSECIFVADPSLTLIERSHLKRGLARSKNAFLFDLPAAWQRRSLLFQKKLSNPADPNQQAPAAFNEMSIVVGIQELSYARKVASVSHEAERLTPPVSRDRPQRPPPGGGFPPANQRPPRRGQ